MTLRFSPPSPPHVYVCDMEEEAVCSLRHSQPGHSIGLVISNATHTDDIDVRIDHIANHESSLMLSLICG